MNILYIDIDSLRPDHLGCYGYHRQTSPNIDALAAEGLRFNNCYVSDAPCLPSRTAMTTGKFGIHTGVINHGGVASQPFIWGPDRGFSCNMTDGNWASCLQREGYHTVGFSPFAQRHGAWHWYAGFMEMHNTGDAGQETADMIAPQVVDWLERRGRQKEPFFMWVNVWDPHTPYRTPADFGNPFADDPLPEWYSEDIRREHWQRPGPHSPQEVNDFIPRPAWMFEKQAKRKPTINDYQPTRIDSMKEARKMFDGYDRGVAFADLHVAKIIARLKELGLYEETAIIISADHGENLGELCIYGDHQTADHITHRVPMIVRWPGITDARAGQSDDRLLYAFDIAATTLDWSGIGVPEAWDGISFASDLQNGRSAPRRDALVLSQAAWCAQRAARWDDYILIETYHDGFHDYPEWMLFDLGNDPHEQHNLADARPDLVKQGQAIIGHWREEQLEGARHPVDPMETVLAEGGPYHVRGRGPEYLKRLEATGRSEAARRLRRKHAL